MKERLKSWYREEREKLRGLHGREKVEYIWTYYKLWIIGVAVFLAITVFLIVRISTNIEGHWLYGMYANTFADAGTGSPLWEDFTQYADLDLKQKKVEFNAEVYFDFLKNQAKGNDYYNAFVALADGGVLDFITMAPDSLAALAESGRLLDLRLEPEQTLYQRYTDRLIWFQGMEGPVPVGVDLSDSLLVTKYGVYSEGCALGVGAKSENLDVIALFLEFLLQKEG